MVKANGSILIIKTFLKSTTDAMASIKKSSIKASKH